MRWLLAFAHEERTAGLSHVRQAARGPARAGVPVLQSQVQAGGPRPLARRLVSRARTAGRHERKRRRVGARVKAAYLVVSLAALGVGHIANAQVATVGQFQSQPYPYGRPMQS